MKPLAALARWLRTPTPRSLRRQLLIWLLLPQWVLWLAAAAFTYALADRYANQAIDASLSTASRALARQVKPSGSGLLIDFPRAAQDIIEADPDDRLYYMVSSPPGEFILGNNPLPAPPPALAQAPRLGQPLFYDAVMRERGLEGRDVAVRVVAMYLHFGDPKAEPARRMLVQVAKSRTSREALAGQILIDTALPLSILMLLMSALVWAGLHTGLKPLERLQAMVEHRAPDDLQPIEIKAAPTEVRALTGALNGLLQQVQDTIVRQRHFISDAAHQLRTPLAGLKGQADLALSAAQSRGDTELLSRIRRVQESANRSAHLVNQLLTLARAEPESASTQGRTRFDLRKLAHEVTAELVPRALAAGLDLGIAENPTDAPGGEIDEQTDPREHQPPQPLESVMVLGNAFLIREAISNLIDNAIRYAGKGAEITVRVHALAAHAQLDVEDTGPGIPQHEHHRVFERFARATHAGNGCGLGLAIVKEIVERHRGQVSLQDVCPHGLRVCVQLPLAL
jgi:two-component system sensor histidine kinase TctE